MCHKYETDFAEHDFVSLIKLASEQIPFIWLMETQ